jgi:hypothetical protein
VVPNREEASGVPPNIEFTTFFITKGAPQCQIFSILQGAVNQKRLKTTELTYATYTHKTHASTHTQLNLVWKLNIVNLNSNFLNCLGISGYAWCFCNCLGNSGISSIALAFPEMSRDFRKCLISAIPCDICKQLTKRVGSPFGMEVGGDIYKLCP